MFNLILTWCIIFILGFISGYKFVTWRVQLLIVKHKLHKFDDILPNSKSTKKIEYPVCYIEQVKDTLYLYDKQTSKFYCQGKNLHELAKNLQKNFKDIREVFAVQIIDELPNLYILSEGKIQDMR
jgi:hypothetical protein